MARFVWGTRSRWRLRPAANPRVEAWTHVAEENSLLKKAQRTAYARLIPVSVARFDQDFASKWSVSRPRNVSEAAPGEFFNRLGHYTNRHMSVIFSAR